jgi:ATP-binding cassette, subfamily C, bacterial
VLFILMALALTLGLRLASILLNVWQAHPFRWCPRMWSIASGRACWNACRKLPCLNMKRWARARVTSHFVTDLNAVDSFLGASISGFLVAVLSLIGVAGVLLWMNWQLALFILLLNPLVIGFPPDSARRSNTLKKRENAAFEAFQEALSETLDA